MVEEDPLCQRAADAGFKLETEWDAFTVSKWKRGP